MKLSKTLLAVLTALAASAGSVHLYAQSALPTCQSASSDADGDGFGWENAASCRVGGSTSNNTNNNTSSADNNAATSPAMFCQSAASDPDGDGFGWENNRSCVVAVDSGDLLPGAPSFDPTCTSASSDPDGDGFGWENNASCIVDGSIAAANDPINNTVTICQSSASDPDGDGFGWENGTSCTVSTDLGTDDDGTQSDSIARNICVFSSSDPDGDGFGWEDNATCVVNSSSIDDGGEPPPEFDPAPPALNPTPPALDPGFSAIAPSGVSSTGTPRFQWNALETAEMYTLAVADSQGNGYSLEIDPVTAGCAGGGVCSATPDLAYYDNDLTWRVISRVNGSNGPETNRIAFTTPQNINVQPVKSGQCEAWPSVAYDKYIVLNNTWNSRAMNSSAWEQKIFVNEDRFGNVRPTWTYDWLGQFDGGEIDVKAYPEVLYGPKLGTHVSGSKAETGLPELVSDLPEFVVNYSYTETGIGERNVALESFFHDSCNIAGPCDDVDNRAFEMMIWVDNPTIRTPGQLALTGVLIDNKLWNVYIKPNSDKHYIAFTAQNPQSTGTINWNRFVEWTQNWTAENATELGIDVLRPEFCMGAIEMGTEMWWGSGSFTLNEFDVSFTR